MDFQEIEVFNIILIWISQAKAGRNIKFKIEKKIKFITIIHISLIKTQLKSIDLHLGNTNDIGDLSTEVGDNAGDIQGNAGNIKKNKAGVNKNKQDVKGMFIIWLKYLQWQNLISTINLRLS